MFTAKEINGQWRVCQDGNVFEKWAGATWTPRTQKQCEDAAQRMNNGDTPGFLPPYNQPSMNRIVAYAPWGDTYTAQDAEDGCIPSEATYYPEEESMDY